MVKRSRRVDVSSVAGVPIGIGFIVLGQMLEGGNLRSILQLTAAVIVFGGTLGAVMVSFPLRDIRHAVVSLRHLVVDDAPAPDGVVALIGRFAVRARKEGLLALEDDAERLSDPFLKRALALAIDGTNSGTLRAMLEDEISTREEAEELPARVFEAAGGYAPTVGILGAVLGLIHVMSNLSDVSKVGAGIAVAFVATIYGVASANLVFLPAANKLKLKHREHMRLCEMTQAGVLALQQGQSPRLIADRLAVFVGDAHGKSAEREARAEKPAKAAA
jgi:chemotaxis protein MotA